MTDMIEEFLLPQRPTAERPLLGQTVLAVEDSRFAGEALRLMCLKGGARIRRADSLRAAARHLTNYRPSVVVVDLGLPDGSGLELISRLAEAAPRVAVLLALSGDPTQEDAALAAGADAFLSKPLGSVSSFHSAILAHLPSDAQPRGPRATDMSEVKPEPEALQDDLAHLANLLSGAADPETLRYIAGFTIGLARSTGDKPLVGSAQALAAALETGSPWESHLSILTALVQDRFGGASVAV